MSRKSCAAAPAVWTGSGPGEKLEGPRASPKPPRRLPLARASTPEFLRHHATDREARSHGRQDTHAHRGRRQGGDGRPARFRTERRAGRSQRLGQDHPGGGAGADRRRPEPGRPGRGRRDRLRPRRDGTAPTAFRGALAGPRRLGGPQDQPAGHTRLRGLRRGGQGRSARGGRGPLRRLGRSGGRRGGGHHAGAPGGVRGRRHADGRRRHAPGHRAYALRRADPDLRPDLRTRRPRRRAPPVRARAGGRGT